MSAQHTPTPWCIGYPNKAERTAAIGIRSDGWVIADVWTDVPELEKQGKANAAFIVRACNGWNDPAALRARLAELESSL